MAPNDDQAQHPPQPAHREPPPDSPRHGTNHTDETTSTPPSPPPINNTTTQPPNEPSPSDPSDPSDTASEASIPSDHPSPTDDNNNNNNDNQELISPSASIPPPYWSSARAAEQQQQQQQQHLQNPLRRPHAHGHHAPGHARGASSASAESVLPPGAITLQDNEGVGDEDEDEDGGGGRRRNGNGEYAGGDGGRRSNSSEVYGRERNRACWARSVQVTDHVLVNGSTTNIGAFVVWNIRVEALNGSRMNIRKRYSEFDDLRRRLVQTFPGFEAAVPALPPKSVLKRFHPRFLEKRRAGLQYFLNCILLNPEFSGSPVLKEFLFS